MKGRILIVDDNEELLVALRILLSDHFARVDTLPHPKALLRQLEKMEYDLVLLDMNFSAETVSGNEGLYWMNRILENKPSPSVVLITAYSSVELAIQGLKGGAVDFIIKSWDNDKILSAILSAYRLHCSKTEVKQLRNKQEHLTENIRNRHFYRGASRAMDEIYRTIEKVAPTDAQILLLGENGTGKEVLAREIHRQSKRSHDILVEVDMGVITETLFESELFGYRKGAFTDAKTNKPGRFEIASGGTLFLDEIGNLSPAMQQKLLTVLESNRITPLGAVRPVEIDIRLICATNADIFRMVEENTFRRDLFYRLNTIIIEIPPLRNRREDIPGLTEFFLNVFNRKYGKEIGFSGEAAEWLYRQDWPGNIRELKHVVEKNVILADSPVIRTVIPLHGQRNVMSDGTDSQTLNLEENEKRIIKAALTQTSGNISDAARQLGINRSTLYEKIRKYQL